MSFNMETVKIEQPPLPGGYDYATLHRSTEGPPGSPPGVGLFAITDCSGNTAIVVVAPDLLTGIIGKLVELRDRLADQSVGVGL